ncbi:hypothetical protein HPB47_014799 [Ixodes persulcatus]|uniref:Uncharacterized protein n=1 Tax=Ixodes persulcatus TaxID=34615 RepID=A0AC60QV46_IXOPE|nr:hypothetical protein HPB47_014799 [Ixodes persulcatus]
MVPGTLLSNVDFMVQEVQRANKAYEGNDADPARLLEDLTLLIKTCNRIVHQIWWHWRPQFSALHYDMFGCLLLAA